MKYESVAKYLYYIHVFCVAQNARTEINARRREAVHARVCVCVCGYMYTYYTLCINYCEIIILRAFRNNVDDDDADVDDDGRARVIYRSCMCVYVWGGGGRPTARPLIAMNCFADCAVVFVVVHHKTLTPLQWLKTRTYNYISCVSQTLRYPRRTHDTHAKTENDHPAIVGLTIFHQDAFAQIYVFVRTFVCVLCMARNEVMACVHK